jgi:hypothetical protein
MKEMIAQALSNTMHELAQAFAHFVPRLVVMLIIIAAGGVIAYVLKVITRGILRVLKFERLSQRAGASRLLTEAALPSSSELLARLVFWLAWLGFILVGISTLGIIGLQEHVSQLFLYLPRILLALLIIFFGLVLASFLSRAALLASVNANLPSARLIATLVHICIVFLAIAMAFEQLGIAQQTILAAFSILFGALMLGLAIAFGLGGQDLARRMLERRFSADNKREREDELSPL